MRRSRLTIGITGAAAAPPPPTRSAPAPPKTLRHSLPLPPHHTLLPGHPRLINPRTLFGPGGPPPGDGAPAPINTRRISGASGASPVDGTVTGWPAAAPQGTYSIQVVRPTAGGAYRALATGPGTALNFPLAPSPIQPASLPIQKGDFPVL